MPTSKSSHVMWRLLRCICAVASLLFAPGISAGVIAPDVWYEFGFTDPGVQATGCFPDDPAGPFCISSSGTPTQFLDSPPWTFTAAGAATLTITDAFEAGDQFTVFDFGVSIGVTSAPAAGVPIDCGDDPVVCLGTAGMSTGAFALAAGSHAITLVPVLAPSGGGAGYLQLVGPASVIPEPPSAMLALLALLMFFSVALRRSL